MLASCSTGRKAQRSETTVTETIYVDTSHMSGRQKAVVEEALEWLGTPYKYGGAEKGEGSDCSGLVTRVYVDMTGIKLPRQSALQAEFCERLDPGDIRPGDLVFFATTRDDPSKVSHVGMVLDSEEFIHSTSSRGVTVTRFDNAWWGPRLLFFGRVPGM